MSTVYFNASTTRKGPPASGFSALEWSVIALAGNDSLESLATPGRLSRAAGSVFGLGTDSRFSDPKLEALRRLAVHAWRRGVALPVAEIQTFISAGFVKAQAETLVRSVSGSLRQECAA